MFQKMLGEKNPSDIDSVDFTIMSSPKRTSKHPALGLNIEEASVIIKSRDINLESRDIPLYAIVSGVGRGKTRYLVELQKELRNTASVLCVAITFNHYWTDIKRPFNTERYSSREQLDMEYAVNIVSRIISMHYHIPFDNAYEMLRTHGVLSIDEDSSYNKPKLLIMKCVEFIVNQCREREGGRGGGR